MTSRQLKKAATITLVHRDVAETICSVLNSEKGARGSHPAAFEYHPAYRDELKRIIVAWNQGKRDVETLLQKMPELRAYLLGTNRQYPEIRLCGLPSIVGGELTLKVALESPHSQRLLSEYDESQSDKVLEEIEKDFARCLFAALLFSPRDRERLSDGCCDRCGRYYVRNRLYQKKYCSEGCARNVRHSAIMKFTSSKREARHKKQLRIAATLCHRWAASRRKQNWKRWVCTRAEGKRAGLTLKFLTRAVNKGELIEPKKGER
jgi:hypothetical protein